MPGKYGIIGWQTFRYTCRLWLDDRKFDEGASEIDARRFSQTTMNVHGQAMSSSKREANGKVVEMVLKKVVEMVLKPFKASA